MISCRNIKKAYMSQVVFNKFSYEFNDKGLYLLFGESGSGKTTLMNILAGYISFDEGEIDFCGVRNYVQINAEEVGKYVEYIMQDADFIDYLTVYDNLTLCCADDRILDDYLEKFGLLDKKNQYPGKLSGGEKQRLCFIRALVQNKKVLLLDEPTAALDEENKRLVFETLSELKKSMLIICSSHDDVAKEYADNIIDFNNLDEYEEFVSEYENHESDETLDVQEDSSKSIGRYIRKWFKSPYKDKRSKIRFSIIIVIALLGLWLGDTPENKIMSSIEYIYGINQMTMVVDKDNIDVVEMLYDRDDIKEIVLNYEKSVPVSNSQAGGTEVNVAYELAVFTLPIAREVLNVEDFLECGRYIEDENEIIAAYGLGQDNGDSENLIGQKVTLNLYDREYEMTIVGVFRDFTDIEDQYFYNSGIDQIDAAADYAISAKITNKYLDDENFYYDSARQYTLYFESYSDMMKFYEEMNEESSFTLMLPEMMVDAEVIFHTLNTYLFPISVIVMVMAVVFYYQTQKTELMYNSKMFVVFQRVGYSVGKIKSAWLIANVVELIKSLIVPSIVAVVMASVVNVINRQIKLIYFEIFSYNIEVLLKMYLAVIVIGIVNALFMMRKIKPENISRNLVEQRDLL